MSSGAVLWGKCKHGRDGVVSSCWARLNEHSNLLYWERSQEVVAGTVFCKGLLQSCSYLEMYVVTTFFCSTFLNKMKRYTKTVTTLAKLGLCSHSLGPRFQNCSSQLSYYPRFACLSVPRKRMYSCSVHHCTNWQGRSIEAFGFCIKLVQIECCSESRQPQGSKLSISITFG